MQHKKDTLRLPVSVRPVSVLPVAVMPMSVLPVSVIPVSVLPVAAMGTSEEHLQQFLCHTQLCV